MKKRTILMLTASVLMAGGLASCQKDRQGSGAEEQGDPTTAMLNLSFKKTVSTRATGDSNATDDEIAIKSADVYVYTESGAYLKHQRMAATDFTAGTNTAGADVWTSSVAIATTTGVKNILVGVNLPTNTATAMENQSMSAASTVVQTIARDQLNTTVGLPMFSVSAVRQDMQSDASQNKVIATLQRLVAKVTVEVSPTVVEAGTPGKIGALTWAINNQNTKYFLIQGRSPSYPDPNWATGSYQSGDYAAATDADYVAVADGPQTPVSDYNAQYALENTSNEKQQQELTRVTVRATFIPDALVTSYTQGQPADPTESDNSASTTVETFYTVTAQAGAKTYYFRNQTDAENYATDKTGGTTAVKTFTGGVCYWNFFLNLTEQGQVFRNDYYKANITRIVAPGNNTSDLTTPTSPVETATNLTVDVDILNWNPIAMEDKELVP